MTHFILFPTPGFGLKQKYAERNLEGKLGKENKQKTMKVKSSTVFGDNINIMKTTFELHFNFYQAFKQQEYTKIWKQREAVNLKSFTLISCKLVIRKKLFNN